MNLTVYQCICHLCMADFCKLLKGGCPPSPPQGKAQICAKRVNKNEFCWEKKKRKKKYCWVFVCLSVSLLAIQCTINNQNQLFHAPPPPPPPLHPPYNNRGSCTKRPYGGCSIPRLTNCFPQPGTRITEATRLFRPHRRGSGCGNPSSQ